LASCGSPPRVDLSEALASPGLRSFAMGKLKHISAPLRSLAPRLVVPRDSHGHSAQAEPWRNWYSLARWKRLRIAVFKRDRFRCQCGCDAAPEGNTSLLVADHKKRHLGDPVLFWAEDNIQTLLKVCHDKIKQAEEKRAAWGVTPRRTTEASPPGRMSRPSWFRKVCVPLTVVCGPPGSGKSTYVRQHAGPGDRIICFDQLATQRFGRSGQTRTQAGLTVDQIADVLRLRNEALGDLMRVKARDKWPAAWLIVSEPKATDRRWWIDTVGARVVVLATPLDECIRRMAVDADAGDVRGETAQRFARDWWRSYTPNHGDTVI